MFDAVVRDADGPDEAQALRLLERAPVVDALPAGPTARGPEGVSSDDPARARGAAATRVAARRRRSLLNGAWMRYLRAPNSVTFAAFDAYVLGRSAYQPRRRRGASPASAPRKSRSARVPSFSTESLTCWSIVA